MSKQNINLIQCHDHSWAPWHIMCRHLFDAPPKEKWIKIELAEDDGREVDGDWLCEDCDNRIQEPGDFDKLMNEGLLAAVCMHCCNHLKEKAGFDESDEA